MAADLSTRVLTRPFDGPPESLDEDSREVRSHLERLRQHIIAHASIVGPIIAAGDIAVVAFEPIGDWAIQVLCSLGWDGSEKPFRLSSGMRKQMARGLDSKGHRVEAKWFGANGRTGRVLVCMHQARYLLNVTEADGYYFEPGSPGAEWLS